MLPMVAVIARRRCPARRTRRTSRHAVPAASQTVAPGPSPSPQTVCPSLKPTTFGVRMYTGWPSTARPRCRPRPSPRRRPLIIVVCESVPTHESGYRSSVLRRPEHRGRLGFTWCTMPVAGHGEFRSDFWPHFRNSYRSRCSNSFSALIESAVFALRTSTCTSGRSRGRTARGLISCVPPSRFIIAIAARSTTHGTPVKSLQHHARHEGQLRLQRRCVPVRQDRHRPPSPRTRHIPQHRRAAP